MTFSKNATQIGHDYQRFDMGYINTNAEIIEAATKKVCYFINYHCLREDIDYMLMNKYPRQDQVLVIYNDSKEFSFILEKM